jgi:polyisoprenoid-binding protein YceI
MIRIPNLLKLALPAAIALAAAPMVAQMPTEAPGKMDKSRVAAGTYTADASHSLIGWKVNHFGFNDYFGLFGDVSGTLTLDPANPAAAKVSATIPVAKLVTASPGLTAHLLRAPATAGGKPDFFGPAPANATFVSTSVVPGVDGTSAAVTGDFTLNGVTKPVTIAASFVGAGTNMMSKAQTVGFSGKATIKRSDFGLASFIPLVSDEVQLDITIAFEKKA